MHTLPPLNRTNWGSGTVSLLMVPPVWRQRSLWQKSRHTSGDSPTSRWPTALWGNPPAKFSPVGRDEDGLRPSHGRRIDHQRRQGERGTPQQHVSSIAGLRPVIALEDFRPGTRSHLHVTTACRTIPGHFFEDSRFLKLETEPIILTLNVCLRTQKVRFKRKSSGCVLFLVLYVNDKNIFQKEILTRRNHLLPLLLSELHSWHKLSNALETFLRHFMSFKLKMSNHVPY